jgi:hypothetical protein
VRLVFQSALFRWLVIAAAACLMGGLLLFQRPREAPSAAGWYLVKGGVDWVRLAEREDGLLDIAEGSIAEEWRGLGVGFTFTNEDFSDVRSYRSYEVQWALRPSISGLELIARMPDAPARPTVSILDYDSPTSSTSIVREVTISDWDPTQWHPVLTVRRSATSPGDFDLVHLETFGWRLHWAGEKAEHERYFDPPISSYLHRIDDERLAHGLDAAENGIDGWAFKRAGDLLADYPDDLHVRGLYLEMALRAGELSALRDLGERWREEFSNSADPYLRRLPSVADYAIEAHELTVAGRNGQSLIVDLAREDATWADWLQGVPRLMDFERAAIELVTLDIDEMPFSNLFSAQIRTKSIVVESIFEMLAGDRQGALDLLAGSYRGASMIGEQPAFVLSIVGASLEHIAVLGIDTYALNVCESPDDLAELMALLDRLDLGHGHPRHEELSWTEPLLMVDGRMSRGLFLDPDQRILASRARLLLLKAAVAARHRLLTSGDWPESDADYEPLLAGGLPTDPFADGPLRAIREGDDLTLYSLGPDGADGGARITYDPSNGSSSAGDIILRVPRQRRYPFPRGGVRASTAEEVQALFPNGLPPDPFASHTGRPLNIADGSPVRIFSWGPNIDQTLRMPIDWGHRDPPPLNTIVNIPLEPPYDPTNGLTSPGDLIWTVPPL